MSQLYKLEQIMCIKIININDAILKTLLNWVVHFNITLTQETSASLNQNSSFFYNYMKEAIENRFWVQSTFKQQSYSSDIIWCYK